MQKVHDAKGRFIAVINDDKTITIVANGCETTICLSGDCPRIKTIKK